MTQEGQLFLRRFAAPLVMGASPACADYVGANAALRMGILPNSGTHAQALWDGMRARAAALDPAPPAPPSKTLTVLLTACHDLLASVHPEAVTMLGHSTRMLHKHTRAVLGRGVPEAMGEALARHAVVEATVSALRVDVTLSWWTGTRQFHGREPPARLTIWPTLRRLKREETRTPIVTRGLAHGSSRLRAARRGLLEALLTSSPLTPLVLAMDGKSLTPLDLHQPGLDGQPTYASLRFVEHGPLRTALADRALAAGFLGPASLLSSAVHAFLKSASPEPWAVVRALRLVGTLHQRRLFAELLARELKTGRTLPLAEALAEKEPVGKQSIKLMYSLWHACRTLDGALDIPGNERELRPLAEELARVVMNAQLVEQSESLVRAVEARLQSVASGK